MDGVGRSTSLRSTLSFAPDAPSIPEVGDDIPLPIAPTPPEARPVVGADGEATGGGGIDGLFSHIRAAFRRMFRFSGNVRFSGRD